MNQKVAIPVVNGLLSAHFGHCQYFIIADVVDGEIRQIKKEVPPPHEPGVIPRWLGALGVNVVLVGGIGQKALELFKQFGINPVIGVPQKEPKQLLEDFINDKLVVGANQCSH